MALQEDLASSRHFQPPLGNIDTHDQEIFAHPSTLDYFPCGLFLRMEKWKFHSADDLTRFFSSISSFFQAQESGQIKSPPVCNARKNASHLYWQLATTTAAVCILFPRTEELLVRVFANNRQNALGMHEFCPFFLTGHLLQIELSKGYLNHFGDRYIKKSEAAARKNQDAERLLLKCK